MRLVVTLASVFWLAGCSFSGDIRLSREAKPYVELARVPFVSQQSYLCGPASLRMVAAYWKLTGEAIREIPGAEVEALAFVPGKKGSHQAQMTGAARQLGLVAIESSQKADLFELLNAGFPVIVLLNQGTDSLPVWHYAVAVGYDLERQEVILRSGETRRQVMKLSTFYAFFEKSGYWKLIAVPATMVPPTVGEAAYIKAVYDLERTLEDEVVQDAYETALAEWPRSLRVKLAAGNYFFDKYQYETAQTLYADVLRKLPDDPIALNNMAETLYYMGEFAEALTFIDKAIKKNRTFKKEFDDTRNKILHSIESGEIILRNGL